MTNQRLAVPTNPARALRDLNRQAPIALPDLENGEEAELSSNTTILQSDKPTNPQTNQQPDNQTNNLSNQLTDQQTNRQTSRQTDKPTSKATNKKRASKPSPVAAEPAVRSARVDGRTLRPRQDTADQTMVTSMRLAVSTLELLDDYCYRHRQRKQDVVQAALDMYFAEDATSE